MPALPDFQDHPLPWVTEREYVFDAHRVVIADFDCDQDEARAHALARFIAAAPETARQLEELTAAAKALVYATPGSDQHLAAFRRVCALTRGGA